VPVMVDVVVPCLNEAPALAGLFARMPAGYAVTVVDNGSLDATAQVAAAHGARVVEVARPGYGAAVHAGILAADGVDDVVCVLDGDGSLDPAELPGLVGPVLAGTAELVVGRRRPVRPGIWPVHARLANRFLAARLRRSSGLAVHDIAPMRACRRADLLALDIQDRRFGYPLELLVKAGRAGWRVHEVDVAYLPRAAGTRSKVSGSVRGTVRAVRDMRAVLAR